MSGKTKNSYKNIIYMLKMLWKGSKAFVFFTFFKETAEGIFWTVFSVYMTEYIYVSIENKTPFKSLIIFIGALSLGHIVIHLISATHQYFSKQLTPEIYRSFYSKVIDKSISMEYTRFEDPNFYDKFTRALNECEWRGLTILNNCAFLAGNIAAIITSIIIIADVDAILLLFIIPMVLISLYFGKKTGELYYKLDFTNTRDGRVGSYVKRVVYEKKYASELRLFPISKMLFKHHEKAYDEIYTRTKDIRIKTARLETIKWITFGLLSTTIPFIYIAFMVNKNVGSTAAYVAMVPALNYLSWRTSSLVEVIVELLKQSAFVNNLHEFLNYQPLENKDVKQVQKSLDDIEMKDVSFIYSGADKPTLHNINIRIKKGERIAFVGHNGAGKTTLVKLIMGLYTVTSGEILISGENINSFEAKSFHSHFGTVFQDLQIFALPLSQNVLMREPENEQERQLVIDSLIKAQFGDKLKSLEKGIDTIVTKEFDENGMGLSGGEAQKIAIARVFAQKPDIVILDEPSSALDPIAEYNMYKNMMQVSKEETVIFISHRLSATREADRIYMFENGTVIEEGTHDDLIALNGKYCEMFNLQAANYSDSEVLA